MEEIIPLKNNVCIFQITISSSSRLNKSNLFLAQCLQDNRTIILKGCHEYLYSSVCILGMEIFTDSLGASAKKVNDALYRF